MFWQDAELTKLYQTDEYDTFYKVKHGTKSRSYKLIQYSIVYALKHNLFQKALLLANGNLTDIP